MSDISSFTTFEHEAGAANKVVAEIDKIIDKFTQIKGIFENKSKSLKVLVERHKALTNALMNERKISLSVEGVNNYVTIDQDIAREQLLMAISNVASVIEASLYDIDRHADMFHNMLNLMEVSRKNKEDLLKTAVDNIA